MCKVNDRDCATRWGGLDSKQCNCNRYYSCEFHTGTTTSCDPNNAFCCRNTLSEETWLVGAGNNFPDCQLLFQNKSTDPQRTPYHNGKEMCT